jgi:hypothetical protein
MMAEIYSCALLTVARQCNDKNPQSVSSLSAPIHRIETPQSSIPVFARLAIPHIGDGFPYVNVVEFPLFKRGWIYQERLLSRRTLHVSDRELSWMCREKSAC